MHRAGLSLLVGFAVLSAIAVVGSSCSSNDMPAPDASMLTDTVPPSACPTGYSLCGSDCVATKRDTSNCGACGKQCKPGEVCVQGGCALQCAGGTIKCNGTCVDAKSDPANCGMCAIPCTGGQVC